MERAQHNQGGLVSGMLGTSHQSHQQESKKPLPSSPHTYTGTEVMLPSNPSCHHTLQQLLAHEKQKADANLVNTLWVFQPGKIHLFHVTGADSTSAWNGGRWPRGHPVPTEHWDVPCGQEPHGLWSQPERQQPQLTHSEHGQ